MRQTLLGIYSVLKTGFTVKTAERSRLSGWVGLGALNVWVAMFSCSKQDECCQKFRQYKPIYVAGLWEGLRSWETYKSRSSPHTVHVRGAVGALEPRAETFLGRLSVDIVGTEKKAAAGNGTRQRRRKNIQIKYGSWMVQRRGSLSKKAEIVINILKLSLRSWMRMILIYSGELFFQQRPPQPLLCQLWPCMTTWPHPMGLESANCWDAEACRKLLQKTDSRTVENCCAYVELATCRCSG